MLAARLKERAWLPVVGVATAATTVVAGWAPQAASAPTTPTKARALTAPSAAAATDGTYESCSAYFGFGKETAGVLSVVDFDVADVNGDDATAHAVDTDTPVVLVLTSDEGTTLECTPYEVTEAQWDAAIDELALSEPDTRPFPSWPGPGHYAFPTVAFEPVIEDFGVVIDVGFRVVGTPDGHDLISPLDIKPLASYFPAGFEYQSHVIDQLVFDYLEAVVGADARDAYEAALVACDGVVTDVPFDEVTSAALNALSELRGWDYDGDFYCGDIGYANAEASFVLNLEAIGSYVEPIALGLPEVATTTTAPSTTVADPAVDAEPAQAVPAQPSYTG